MPARTMLGPGQIVGGYRLVEKIGRGGTCEMWLAVKLDQAGGDFKRFAIKILLPELVEDDDLVRMFVSEARLAAKLEHPNVVQVFEAGDHEDRIWFSQEYVEGFNLRDIRRAAPSGLPYPLVAFIVGDILEALVYAHEMPGADGQPLQIVHRDVKPSNVMVANLGHVKLADFGIAKRLGESAVDVVHTKTGHVRGTIGYMAPELLLGAHATHLSDLYAVGIVMWELLAGRRLFSGEDAHRKNIEAQVPPLRSLNVNIPLELERVLFQLLCRDVAARFRSAQVAQHALRGAPGGRDAAAAELRSYLGALMASRRLVSASTEAAERATREFRRSAPSDVRKAEPQPANNHEPRRADGTGSGSMGLGIPGLAAASSPRPAARVLVGLDSSRTAATVAGQVSSRQGSTTSWKRSQVAAALAAGAAAVAVGVGGAVTLLSGSRVPARVTEASPAVSDGGSHEGRSTVPVALAAAAAPAFPTETLPVDAAPDESLADAGVAGLGLRPGPSVARPNAAQPRTPGKLVVKVMPWANVFVDGRSVGVTPVSRELTPGKHRVKLVNEELHKEERMTVTIGLGEESVLERRW
jgi:serine/threonine protein kinase